MGRDQKSKKKPGELAPGLYRYKGQIRSINKKYKDEPKKLPERASAKHETTKINKSTDKGGKRNDSTKIASPGGGKISMELAPGLYRFKGQIRSLKRAYPNISPEEQKIRETARLYVLQSEFSDVQPKPKEKEKPREVEMVAINRKVAYKDKLGRKRFKVQTQYRYRFTDTLTFTTKENFQNYANSLPESSKSVYKDLFNASIKTEVFNKVHQGIPVFIIIEGQRKLIDISNISEFTNIIDKVLSDNYKGLTKEQKRNFSNPVIFPVKERLDGSIEIDISEINNQDAIEFGDELENELIAQYIGDFLSL